MAVLGDIYLSMYIVYCKFSLINTFTSSGLFYQNSLDWSISKSRCPVSCHCDCFIEIPVANANSVDPDQMLHSDASYLGLHCLPVTLLGVSRLKWVNLQYLP